MQRLAQPKHVYPRPGHPLITTMATAEFENFSLSVITSKPARLTRELLRNADLRAASDLGIGSDCNKHADRSKKALA